MINRCLGYKAANKALANPVSLVSETWSSYTRSRPDTTMAMDTGEMEGEIAPDQEIDFCTMGMFIVGECLLLSLLGQACKFYQCGAVRGLPAELLGHKTGSIVCALKKFLKSRALYCFYFYLVSRTLYFVWLSAAILNFPFYLKWILSGTYITPSASYISMIIHYPYYCFPDLMRELLFYSLQVSLSCIVSTLYVLHLILLLTLSNSSQMKSTSFLQLHQFMTS